MRRPSRFGTPIVDTSMPPSDPTSPPISSPVTLRLVAETAGVSVSTASRALNGQARKYRISASTEKAVRRVADELGFQASQVARSLRLKQSGLIGVIVPDISNPFFAAIAREVSLGVDAEGFSVLLGDSREETDIEIRLARQLRAKQVEALLVCPVGVESEHLVELERSGLPVVVADRVFEDIALPSVTSDNLSAARDVADVLIAKGHRRIGVVSGVRDSLPAKLRLQGLQESARKAGFQIDDSLIAGDAFTQQSGYDATIELLKRHPELTALFCMCTPSAIGAMRALAEQGLVVPDDVSVVGFDNHPFAELMKTPLTVSVQDIHSLGKTATDILIHRLRPESKQLDRRLDPASHPSPWKIQTTLLERNSVSTARH